jgi:hypothetical protein
MERGTKGGKVSLLPVGVPWLAGFTNRVGFAAGRDDQRQAKQMKIEPVYLLSANC